MNGGIIGKALTARGGLITVADLINSDLFGVVHVPAGATVWDALASASGRTDSNITLSVNSSLWRYGSAAVNMIKTATSTTDASTAKDGYSPTIDLTGKYFGMLFYVAPSALAKISFLSLKVGQSGTAFFEAKLLANQLRSGWNLLEAYINSPAGSSGSPTKTAVDYNAFMVRTFAQSQTIAEGELVANAIYYR